jgi:UDP-galactose transporter B1
MGSDNKEKQSTQSTQLTAAQRIKLLQGAAGIYFFFINYGKLQEKIFAFKSPTGQKFNAVWFLQVIDSLANVILGAMGRAVQGNVQGMPQPILFTTGLCQVLSKYCLSASLASGLSFPVATLAKSAKMVPVMIGSLLIGGATFTSRQIAQAAAIVGGTSIVNLSEGGGKGKSSSTLGLLYILAALGCDGVVGGVQKRMKAELKSRGLKELPYDMMFWQNLYMAVCAAVFAAVLGELKTGYAFCRANPAIGSAIAKFAVCGAMGQACIFYTIANFDPVVCTAVTTTRKLMSVLISLADGEKSLNAMGKAGLGLASVGIMGEVI